MFPHALYEVTSDFSGVSALLRDAGSNANRNNVSNAVSITVGANRNGFGILFFVFFILIFCPVR